MPNGAFGRSCSILPRRLCADPAFKSEAERVKALREGGGGGRSSYFKYAKTLCSKAVDGGASFHP